MTLQDEPQAILELCTPPPRYHFVRGIWASHDVTWQTVTDLVAPTLAGVGADTQQRRRQVARGDARAEELLVFGAGDRFTPGPAHSWAHFVEVRGRRQHAKFGILQFGNETGGRTLTRAFVTSANLTDTGLCRNRELLLWEEVHRTSARGLVGDVVNLIRTLLDEIKPLYKDGHDRGRRLLVRLRRNGVHAAKPSGYVRASISSHGTAGGTLLDGLAPPGPADRLVIVSPPFGSDPADAPALAVGRWCGPDTRVEIYTRLESRWDVKPGKGPGPAFSSTARRRLAEMAGDVAVFGVPDLVEPGEPGTPPPLRRLHAKLYAVVVGPWAYVAAGSANFTSSGLAGFNREVLVHLPRMHASSLDEFLGQLGAVAWPPTGVRPSLEREHVSYDPPLEGQVTATFLQDPGQSPLQASWTGVLVVRIVGVPPDHVSIADQVIHETGAPSRLGWEGGAWVLDVRARLPESCSVLDVGYGTRNVAVPVEIRPAEDDFWRRIDHDDVVRVPDPLVELLVRDIREVPPKGNGRSNGNGNVPEDGTFRLPLEQRLVALARARARLDTALGADTVLDRLGKYLRNEGHEAVDVGRAVASAYLSCGPQGSGSDRLLDLLRVRVRTFDDAEEADDLS